jgi:archaellum component FlaC
MKKIEEIFDDVLTETSTDFIIMKLTNIVRDISGLTSKHLRFLTNMDEINKSPEDLRIEKEELKQKIKEATIALFEEIDVNYDDWVKILEESRNQNKVGHYCNSIRANENIRSFNGHIDSIEPRFNRVKGKVNRLIKFINDIAEEIDKNCKTAKKQPPISIILTKKLKFKK